MDLKSISWIAGRNGEDGLLLERGALGKNYLVVEDVRSAVGNETAATVIDDVDIQVVSPRTLMMDTDFEYDEHVRRQSFTAIYFPLIPSDAQVRVELVGWSPRSDSVSFTRDNNIYIRRLTAITKSPRSAKMLTQSTAMASLINATRAPWYHVQFSISHPDAQPIKYPKACAHNPVVDIKFCDVAYGNVSSVTTGEEFFDDNHITVLVKQTNRISEHLKAILLNFGERQSKTIKSIDNGRPEDGYIDTVIYDDYKHIGYFTPLNNSEPIMLTSRKWEVDEAPSAVDLVNSLVYFVATKESSIQIHVYFTPYQNVVSTPFNSISYDIVPFNSISYDFVVEYNAELADRAKKHTLLVLKYGTVDLDDRISSISLNYSKLGADFQAYVTSNLDCLVITVDPRVSVRSQLGLFEARDYIAAACHFASLNYITETRLAICSWLYDGCTTLKTLEQAAAGRSPRSTYTERYMVTPQEKDNGYSFSKISSATALGENKRFMLMYGVVDDNVHFQNSFTLADSLNLAGVKNYDVHIFPDSDHDIDFHNANRIIYDKLNNWLFNAFNGEWLKISYSKPSSKKVYVCCCSFFEHSV
ncbi:Alpha/Beta hydrolase protein [Trichoderma sp. SZMC 28013]